MNLKLLAGMACLLTLTACSKGVSIGSEVTAGTDESRKLDVANSKTMSVGKSANVTATVAAAQLMSQGMRAVAEVGGLDMAKYVHGVKFEGKPLDQGDAMAKQALQDVDQVRERLFKYADADPVRIQVAEKLLACTDLAADQRTTCLADFYTRVSAAGTILASSWPQREPGFKHISVDGISQERLFKSSELQPWLRGSLTVAQAANKLQAGWARELEGAMLRDPEAAGVAIVEKLFTQPLAQVKGALQQVDGTLTAKVTKGELLAPLEVFVPEVGDYLVENEKGLSLQRGGSTWFGDGYLEGYKTELALQSNSSASMERKRSVALDRAEKAAQTAKAGINLN